MSPTLQATIEQLETRLRQAQLAGDADALAELLADDLLFNDMQGRLVSKAEDLAAHRSGQLRLTRVQPLAQQLRALGAGVVLSAVLMRVVGTQDGAAFDARVRYLRVWAERDGRWQVAGGSVSNAGEA